jgi:hypothetical protein
LWTHPCPEGLIRWQDRNSDSRDLCRVRTAIPDLYEDAAAFAEGGGWVGAGQLGVCDAKSPLNGTWFAGRRRAAARGGRRERTDEAKGGHI